MFGRRGLRGSLLWKGSLAVAGCAALMPQHTHSEAFVLPQVGLGLWKSKPGDVGEAVKTALRSGYQLLDGAAAYSNEIEVGEALAECIAQGIVMRDDVIVVSKLFNTHHVWQGDRSRPAAALAKTLADLQLEYLDLYLMHWPLAFEQTDMAAIGGLRLENGTPNPKLVMEFEYLETWREMLALKRQGKARHLGVCNFTVEMLRSLMAAFPADEWPEVNQVELHPYLAQPELVAFCREHGIALMAYSPLGSADSYSGASFPAQGSNAFESRHGGTPLLKNAIVGQIAAKHRVLVAWSVRRGFTCLPKSVQPVRIVENLVGASLPLDEADMRRLAELDCGFRYSIGYCPGFFDCPNAPWYQAPS